MASPPTNFTNLLWARSTSVTDLITNNVESEIDALKMISSVIFYKQPPLFCIKND